MKKEKISIDIMYQLCLMKIKYLWTKKTKKFKFKIRNIQKRKSKKDKKKKKVKKRRSFSNNLTLFTMG